LEANTRRRPSGLNIGKLSNSGLVVIRSSPLPLVSTALAALVDPRWVLAIVAVGLASINVALTGFCVVGNALSRLGFTPMLGTRSATRGRWYLMQTDKWYLERRIYLAVGINISLASVLVLSHSVWWLLFTGFVGVAMVWFAATGFCIMANSLYWLGAEPRLVPEHSPTPVGALIGDPAARA